MEHEYKKGQQHYVGHAPPRQQRELTPEERAFVERQNQEFAKSAEAALKKKEADPSYELAQTHLLWARVHQPQRLAQAEARSHEVKQHAVAQDQSERRQRSMDNEKRTLDIATCLDSIAQSPAVSSVVETTRRARVDKWLPEGAMAKMRHEIAMALSRLLGKGASDGTRQVISSCCQSFGRRDTIDNLAADLKALAQNLYHALAFKIGSPELLFSELPTPEAISQCIEGSGHRALAANAMPAPVGTTGITPPAAQSHPDRQVREPQPASMSSRPVPSTHQPLTDANEAASQRDTQANAHAQKRVQPFPEGSLRPGDDVPLDMATWMRIMSARPMRDGPVIVGPVPIKVAGIVTKHEAYLLWQSHGRVMGWMPASELPPGGCRRGEWLLWTDGTTVETLLDWPTDLETIKQHTEAKLDKQDLKTRQAAATEKNHDVEHFVATGSSIQHAMRQSNQVDKDVLATLALGVFDAFSVNASGLAAGEALEALGEAIGRKLGRGGASTKLGAGVEHAEKAVTFKERVRDMGGRRQSAFRQLTEKDVARLKQEFEQLGGDPSMLKFNEGNQTSYRDESNTIMVRGDVLPLEEDGHMPHPRSLMSSRAALGHELGHAAHRGTQIVPGMWNDEFRASYWAAKNLKALSPEERYFLILDALERAKEAGVSIKWNSFIRGVIHGLE